MVIWPWGAAMFPQSLDRPRRGARPDSDVRLGDPTAGQGIVDCLRVKGYCVVNDALRDDQLQEAVACIEGEAVDFYRPAVLVQEGLLGAEGSNRIAKVPGELEPQVEGMRDVDELLSQMVNRISPLQEGLDFRCSLRTFCLLHEACDPLWEEEVDLADKEANEWCSVFLSRKIMVLLFLGPDRGTLELTPYDEDANPFDIATFPGQVVILRTDQMSFKFSTRGSKAGYVASTFMIQGDILGMHRNKLEQHVVPATAALNNWISTRLEELKDNEAEKDVDWNELEATVPRNFIAAANRSFFNKQQVSVRGFACRQPSCWDSETVFLSQMAGADVGGEVPILRWDHDTIYDPNPDGYRQMPPKTNTRHASFIDGVELFDAKLFALSIAEVKGMDPSQRLCLETTYEALLKSGMKKSALHNSTTGMYVGMSTSEWNYAERTADVGVFGATGGAPSICAGRLSFCLGCKGASLAIDTEAASGLSAVYFAAESVEKKGRGLVQEIACGIGLHLILAKAWWPALTAAGFLSPEGRCFTFDQSADGWIRSEGIGAAAVRLKPEAIVDGELVEDTLPSVGTIAGGNSMNSGRSAGMSAPSAASQQQLLVESCRKTGIMPSDVDFIEVNGNGKLMHDAVEVASAAGCLRDSSSEILALTAGKTNAGSAIEAAGLVSLARVIFSLTWGITLASQHIRQLNPYLDTDHLPMLIGSETIQHPVQGGTFGGISGFGMGGTVVHLHLFGSVDEEKRRTPPKPVPEALKPRLTYWPSGGGHLELASRPVRGFFIQGSWNEWAPQAMKDEGDGCHSFTMVLGSESYEEFQINLDGNAEKLLRPPFAQAAKGTEVCGPDTEPDTAGMNTWLIDARSPPELPGDLSVEVAEKLKMQLVNPDHGLPGDKYRISLHSAGKWRTVTWSKVDAEEKMQALQN